MAGSRILKNKPLVEAIFELRWNLHEPVKGIFVDPNYRVLVGRVHSKIEKEYPFHEELPTVSMPDEISAYVTQHRFRKGKDDWPLLQIGPGIFTLNDTNKYTWDDFRTRISDAVTTLFDAYPESSKSLKVNGLLLRYLDAIDFEYSNNVLDFLNKNMKFNVKLIGDFFNGTGVKDSPIDIDMRLAYSANKPKGIVNLRFLKGGRNPTNKSILVWDTSVQLKDDNTLKTIDDVMAWVDQAHVLTDDWFFKIIEGELERRFE